MQIKRNPWLRALYLTMLLPIGSGIAGVALVCHAFLYTAGWQDRAVELLLALLAGGAAVKCWGVTLEFARDMRLFLETLGAIRRGELVVHSTRAGLPEIEDLARELNVMGESPDTSLVKWIVLSRDHQAVFMRLVEAVSASLAGKSFYARGHSGRVAEYSTLICRELGITPEQGDRVRLSALLHDIGKIGMDQKILTKPGELTAEEFEILKTHPVRGVEMLRSVTEFADLLPGIELHHESLDGKGYPHGLCADEIPLMARIIAVADSFDAMTHDRTYQTAMEGAYALRIIRTLSGRKFDEKVVEALCRVYASGEIVLPKRKDTAKKQDAPEIPVPAPSLPELAAAVPKAAAEAPTLARILSD